MSFSSKMFAAKDDYQEFKNILNDLKLNSKPLINTLTILAERKIQSASQIVRALEERILETKSEYILPALYVLDSIVKNLRSSIYVQLFETKLPVLFSIAFHKVDEDTRAAMFKLRKTWTPFFTNLSLYNLDTRTHDIDPAWPITAQVPDPPPFSQDLPRQNSSAALLTPADVRPQDDSDSTVFRTRTVNQPPASLAPPKLSELTSRADTYHMIPIERMERIRQETAHVLDLGVDGEQQSKIKKLLGKKKRNKKRRPSARLRRRAIALSQATVNQNYEQQSSADDGETSDGNENEAEEDEDEPLVIKQSSALANGYRIKPPENFNPNPSENLFGNTDKDYRETDTTTTKSSNSSNLDADSIFDINSKCLSLAEQKYKSNELSSEEYQATLKLLQNILQSEVKRLVVQRENPSSPVINSHPQPANPPPSHPFQQQLLQFTQQHAPQASLTTPQAFPFSGFGIEAYRHVMQILATVGAPSSYTSHYNFLPYIPPLPPAPPSFTLAPHAFQPSQPSLSADGQSPPIKRLHEEAGLDEENKRPRYDPVTGRETKTRHFDEENVAPVPSLLEADINMLRKRYIGIVQQLYAGKYQCRLCGLRFTAREKHAYTSHLDWHYFENRQEKDLNTTKSNTLMQRTQNWYPSVQEWTIYEDNLEEQIRLGKLMTAAAAAAVTQIRAHPEKTLVVEGENTMSANGTISCPATGNDDRCYVCHDPFENFFDDNREEWHLRDAMRVEGKTYHPICYQDVQDQTKTATNELPAADGLIDETSNASSDLVPVEKIIDSENGLSEPLPTTEDTAEVDPQSSASLVDIIETLFMKKDQSSPSEQEIPVAPTDSAQRETTVD